ncbi:MAG: tRNA 2-thiouridine(34) synthase MnmA [Sphaerochaetaceae bacterium]|nr:tRNA 2-thiouridine(34) synthase MnmA [Sphaerochaetaceae bacterium]
MRILVGMSGGIDSSVAALLLKKAGHEVVGVTMSIWREGNPFSGELRKDACFGPNEEQDIAEGRRISELLDIEYHVLDCAAQYERIVLENFRSEYLAGRTPNPCIWCNSLIKFGALPQIARESGIKFDKFATGHYAQVAHKNNRWLLTKALDEHKDQTYFLYRLNQVQLSQVMFPLGTIQKEEARRLCIEYGFFSEGKAESQDFYSGDYSELLQTEPKKGAIVDTHGNTVGEHLGYWNYTIGQRRGLGVAAERPWYVVALDAEKNQVIVGHNEDTFENKLLAERLNWIAFDALKAPMEAEAKIRSTGRAKPVLITPLKEGVVSVSFAEPQKAVTPGQSVVFYQDKTVLGGGVIQ